MAFGQDYLSGSKIWHAGVHESGPRPKRDTKEDNMLELAFCWQPALHWNGPWQVLLIFCTTTFNMVLANNSKKRGILHLCGHRAHFS
jgi:hypothetical protein